MLDEFKVQLHGDLHWIILYEIMKCSFAQTNLYYFKSLNFIMPRCIKYSLDMEKTKNTCCSSGCSELDLQERIEHACKNDDSHTHNMIL